MTATEEADEKAAAVVDAKDTDGKGGRGAKTASNTETGVEGALGKGEKKWLNDQVFIRGEQPCSCCLR